MKILLVDPASDWSTRDVYNGLRDGLLAAGHEVIQFRYGRMSQIFSRALYATWEANGGDEQAAEPTQADTAYLVSSQVVTWALRHQPDWTIVVSGMFFHPDAYILMKRAGCKVALLCTESPYDIDKEGIAVGLVDFAWTNERTAVDVLRSVNPNVQYLRHAYHPSFHFPREGSFDQEIPDHDVVFIGTGFRERVKLLETADWSGIDLGLYGAWPLIPEGSPLTAYVRGGIIPNDRAAEFYRRARITLNLFRQSIGFGNDAPLLSGAESLGPRAYELAACGTFFVSERRPEVEETFGDLVPTFDGPEELEAVIRRWIADAPGRASISAALPGAVSGHSWVDRARQVVADLESIGR
jgi:hypothetical protein